MFNALIPARSVEEIVGGQIRVQLGGTSYVLPELAMEPADIWAASIDDRLYGLLQVIDETDEEGIAPLFKTAEQFQAEMLDLLIAYDGFGLLPARAVILKTATHTQLMFALLGVWASTKSPLAATVLAILNSLPETTTGTERAPTSPSNGNVLGRLAKLVGV